MRLRHYLIVLTFFLAVLIATSRLTASSVQNSFILDFDNAVVNFTQNRLNDSSLYKELIFSENENKTVYVKIPKNSTIFYSNISFRGFMQPVMSMAGGPYENIYDVFIWNVKPTIPYDEIIVGTNNPAFVRLLNSTGGSLWGYEMGDSVYSVAAGNLSSDEGEEIVAGDDLKICLLNSFGNEKWCRTINAKVYDIDVEDVLPSIQYDEVAFSAGSKIYLYDSSGSEVWSYTAFSECRGIAIGNISADIGREIVAACGKDLYCFNSSGVMLWNKSIGTPINDIDVDDVNSSLDYDEIVLAGSNGTVFLLDNLGNLVWKFSVLQSINSVKIDEVTNSQYIGKEVVAGSTDDNVYVLSSSGSLIWNFKTMADVRGVGVGNLSQIVGNEVVVGTSAASQNLFILNFEYYPENLRVDLANDSTIDWFFSGKFRSANFTSNNTALQNYLNTCVADKDGNCDIPIVFHSDFSGNLNITSINIAFQYNFTNLISYSIINEWSRTDGIYVNETVGNVVKNITYIKNPTLSVSSKYIKVSSLATTCDFNGVKYSVIDLSGLKVCDISKSSFTIPSTGSLPITKIWDDTMSSGVPVKINEFDEVLESGYLKKNITIWNETTTIFTNVIANTAVNDSLPVVPNAETHLKVDWFNNGSLYDITPVATKSSCNSSSDFEEKSVEKYKFYVCKMDTNNNGIAETFVWKQPDTNRSFARYEVWASANNIPKVELVEILPSPIKWGNVFNLTVNLTDEENDKITVKVCLNLTKTFDMSHVINRASNLTNVVFNCIQEANISSGSNITFEFETEKNWTGYNLLLIKYNDYNESNKQYYHEYFSQLLIYGPNVTKHNTETILLEGEGKKVNRTGSPVLLKVLINDTDENRPVEGARCVFWVTKNGSAWDDGYTTVSDKDGNCTYLFSPNVSYKPGEQKWKAGVLDDFYYNDSTSSDFDLFIYGVLNIKLTNESFAENALRGEDKVLEAVMLDEFGNRVEIAGYNCSWYLDTFNNYMGSTFTNSSGYCRYTWKTNCSYNLSKYEVAVTLTGNLSQYYFLNDTTGNGTFDLRSLYLLGKLNFSIVSPEQGKIFYTGENITLNSSVLDYCGGRPTENFAVKWNVSVINEDRKYNITTILDGENTTFATTPMIGRVNITAKAFGQKYAETIKNTFTWIYGWSDVRIVTPQNGIIFGKNETVRNISISCFVFDNSTNDGLGYYPVSLYENSKLLMSGYTSSSHPEGWFNYTWNVDKVVDGNYTLTCNISSNYTSITGDSNYNALKNNHTIWLIIRENDTTPPEIVNITVNSTTPGNDVKIEAFIRDWYGVNASWINITYPNATSEIIALRNTTPNLIATIWTVTLQSLKDEGDYDFVLYANDSSANGTLDPSHTSWKSSWFGIYKKENTTYSTKSLYAGGTTRIKLNFFRSGTNYKIYEFNLNSTIVNITNEIFKRKYDLEVVVDADLGGRNSNNNKIKLYDLDITQKSSFYVDAGYFDTSWTDTSKTGFFDIKGFIFKTNLSFSKFDVSINYSNEFPIYKDNIFFSETGLKIWKCSDWNYSSQECKGSWESYEGTKDYLKHIITVTGLTNFSVFAAGNDVKLPLDGGAGPPPALPPGGGPGAGVGYVPYCGNNICDAGETPETCPQDCVSRLFSINSNLTEAYMKPGESRKYALFIKSNSNSPIDLKVEVTGDLKRFLNVLNSFTLNPYEEKIIPIYVSIPSYTETGKYVGNIIVSERRQTERISSSITVTEKLPVRLDVIIEALDKRIETNKTGRFKVTLYNLGLEKRFSTNLTYSIKEALTGQIVYNETETKSLYASESFIKEIHIKALNQGKYYIILSAKYEDKESISTDTFEVYAPLVLPVTWIAFAIGAVILSVSAVFGRRKYVKWKQSKVRYIFPVDFKSLPAGNLWLGKIAETDRKMMFDMSDLTTHVLVAGATGSGKSVAGNIFVEEMLDKKIPVVVFDPTGQWTGFVRPCTDPKVLKYYKKHGMKPKNARFYPGNIIEVTDPKEKIDLRKYLNPGEATIFLLNKLKPGDYDVAVTNIVDSIFEQGWEESIELKLAVVFDEVHRLLEKYGGKGGYIAIERACREFRKWGIGMIMISQILSDFKEAIKGNVLTELQMHTKSVTDLQRVEKKYGLEYAKRVARQEVGIGMMQNPKYNKGVPWFISFRPPLHMPHKIPAEELAKYKEYNLIIEKIELEIEKRKKAGKDVENLLIDLKLAKDKLKHGMFRMAEIYIQSLKEKLGI